MKEVSLYVIMVMPWYSGYGCLTFSFNKAWTQLHAGSYTAHDEAEVCSGEGFQQWSGW